MIKKEGINAYKKGQKHCKAKKYEVVMGDKCAGLRKVLKDIFCIFAYFGG